MEGLRAVGAVSAVGAWAPQGAAGACRVEPSRAGPVGSGWAGAGVPAAPSVRRRWAGARVPCGARVRLPAPLHKSGSRGGRGSPLPWKPAR